MTPTIGTLLIAAATTAQHAQAARAAIGEEAARIAAQRLAQPPPGYGQDGGPGA